MIADALLTSPRGPFASWLRQSLGAGEAFQISDVGRPTGGGWSNETIFLAARDGSDAAARRFVMKIAPAGAAMFRDYDLSREFACKSWAVMMACWYRKRSPPSFRAPCLAARSTLWLVSKGKSRPTIAHRSWTRAGCSRRRQRINAAFYDECVAAIARLHRIDRATPGVSRLERAGRHETHLGREVHWLQELYDWGHGRERLPAIDEAFAMIWRALPNRDDATLLWGDARPANIVVRDFRVAALLDWELAALGPGELDLFWFLEMNRMRARGRPLAGFRSDEDTIALYERMRGVVVRNHGFFRYFSALKIAVLMLRHLQARVAAGDLAVDHAILRDNTAVRRLIELGGP